MARGGPGKRRRIRAVAVRGIFHQPLSYLAASVPRGKTGYDGVYHYGPYDRHHRYDEPQGSGSSERRDLRNGDTGSVGAGMGPIYICIYGEKKDYFKPVTFIYDKFINSKEINDFSTYEDLFKNKKIPLSEIKNSKQYIGHKLLWYLDMSIRGNKFSLGMDANLLNNFN